MAHPFRCSPTKPLKGIYKSRTFDHWSAWHRPQSSTALFSTRTKEAHSLQPKVDGDRRKIDEYLESVRDIEKAVPRFQRRKSRRLEPTLSSRTCAPEEGINERTGTHEVNDG